MPDPGTLNIPVLQRGHRINGRIQNTPQYAFLKGNRVGHRQGAFLQYLHPLDRAHVIVLQVTIPHWHGGEQRVRLLAAQHVHGFTKGQCCQRRE